jgi:acetyl-CoA carboxylase carboxyl transferase subunit alpha
MHSYLDFEKSIAELEGKAEELRNLARQDSEMDIAEEVQQIEKKAAEHLQEIYRKLSPWQKCMVSRHPFRPRISDYIKGLFHDFVPLAGDRVYADDASIVGGLARFRGQSLVVLGHEKGQDTESRIRCNFGMAHPEGYRKAVRLMKLADHFSIPVVTFVDTPGAYPGKEAEERGQAEAIARSIETCLSLEVPIITVIIGEGGSGGAIAIAAASKVAMLEFSIYGVISPEGCASILWKSSNKVKEAAEALCMTAQDLLGLGVIDSIIPEPIGGAHRDKEITMNRVGDYIFDSLEEFSGMPGGKIKDDRRIKFMEMSQQSKQVSEV